MSKYYTTIIADDEQSGREILAKTLSELVPNLKIIGYADNTRDTLYLIKNVKPDLVFLDIKMPDHDGFWVVEQMQLMKLNIPVIFVTSHNEYTIKAIRYAAFDYLLKPIDTTELKKAVERFFSQKCTFTIEQKIERLTWFLSKNKIRFNTIEGFILVKPENIIYCQADGNYTLLCFNNNTQQIITLQLGKIEKKLYSNTFIRISRSIIINSDYLESYNRKTKIVYLSDDFLNKYEFKVSSSGARRLMLF